MLVAMVFVGATVGLAGGGLSGLAAGGAAGVIAVLVVVVAMNVIAIGTLIGYFAWAVRRGGDVAGQTLGHQIAGVRIVRASAPPSPIRGRRLVARELARYAWLAGIAVIAMFAAAATRSPSLGNLLILAGVGGVAWVSAPDRLPHDRIARTRSSWPTPNERRQARCPSQRRSPIGGRAPRTKRPPVAGCRTG